MDTNKHESVKTLKRYRVKSGDSSGVRFVATMQYFNLVTL